MGTIGTGATPHQIGLEVSPRKPRIIDYIWDPSAYFDGLREKQPWLAAFVICSLAAIGVGIVTFPFLRQGYVNMLSGQLQGTQLAESLANFDRGRWLGMCLSPILLLAKLAIEAVVLAIIAGMASGRASFRANFSLLVHLQPIILLQNIVSAIVLEFSGLESIHTLRDVAPSIGLDMFLPDKSNMMLVALLGSFNPFAVMWVIYFYLGIRKMLSQKRPAALAIVGIYWALTLAIAVGLGLLTQDMNTYGI